MPRQNSLITICVAAKRQNGEYDEKTKTVKYIEGASFPNDGNNFIVPEEYRNSYIVMDGQNFVFDGQKVRLFDEALKETQSDADTNNSFVSGE